MFFCLLITDESGEQWRGQPRGGVWGHAPPENFEILVLWNDISSVLRGQILSKMFSKSIVLFMLIFIGMTSRRSSQFYLYKLCSFVEIALDITFS